MSYQNFSLKNSVNEYVTDDIIHSEKPIFIVSLYKASTIGKSRVKKIVKLMRRANSLGADFYIVSGETPEETASLFGLQPKEEQETAKPDLSDVEILYTDYKTAISLNRINGGLIYINEGVIVQKWGKNPYPYKSLKNIISTDSKVITAMAIIGRNLFMEISVIVIFFMITIVRFISKRLYIKSLFKKSEV